MAVLTKRVSEIIDKLECEKSAGPDGIGAAYMKFSNIKIRIIVIVFHIMFSSWVLATSHD